MPPRDAEASQRRQEFQIGWFGDPIFFGNYPKSMREGIGGGRLPEFTAKEQRLRDALGEDSGDSEDYAEDIRDLDVY